MRDPTCCGTAVNKGHSRARTPSWHGNTPSCYMLSERGLACSARQKHAKRASNKPTKSVDAPDSKMSKKTQSLRTLLQKNVPRNDDAAQKHDGGETRDGDNGATENTTAVDIGLPRPQGCSRSFMDANGEGWEEFEGKFHMYALATDLAKESGAMQVTTLLLCLVGRAVEAYEGFSYTAEQNKHNLQCVTTKYNQYYSASRARNIARANDDDVTTKTYDHELTYTYALKDAEGKVLYRGPRDA